MSAPKNMAKRAAAGTLALAVCFSGGALVFAGAANADVTTTVASITSGGAQIVAVAPSDTSDALADIVYNSGALVTDATTAGNTVTFALAGTGTGETIATLPTATLAGGVGAGPLTVTSVDPTHFTVQLPNSHTTNAGTLTLSGLTLAGGRLAQTAGTVTLTGTPGVGSAFPVATLGTTTAAGLGATDNSIATATTVREIIKSSGQALDDTAVTLPAAASWTTGDRLVFELPAGVTFNSTPTVTASKASGTGTVTPTFTVTSASTSDDPTTTTTDPVAASRRVIVTFNNSKATTAAEAATSWKLTFSGLGVDVASSYTGGTGGDSISIGNSSATNATTDTNGKIYAQTVNNNSGGFTTSTLVTTTTPLPLAYIEPAWVSVPTGSSFVPGGGLQAAPAVTITEAQATSLSTGSLAIKLVDSAGNPLALDNSSLTIGADAYAPTLTVNGAAVTTGTFTYNAGTGLLTTPSVTATTSVDTVKIGNLRFAGTKVGGGDPVGYIQAELVTPAAAVVNAVPGNLPVSATVSLSTTSTRLGGATRYDTAAQIANAAYSGNYNEFVLANGDGAGIDALSGNYVSGAHGAPLLITSSDSLPSATLAYLQGHIAAAGTQVNPTVVKFDLMGGAGVVSQGVITQLMAAYPLSSGYQLVFNRNDGANRYATAADAAINAGVGAVHTFTGTYGTAAVRTAIIASGINPADAVVAGGISGKAGFPLLLTAPDALPTETITALQTLGIKQVIIIGGTAAINDSVGQQLNSLNITAIRIAGSNRFETATKLADWARTPTVTPVWASNAGLGYDGAGGTPALPSWTSTPVLIANGTSFADVLTAGQLSGGTTYKPIITTVASPLTDKADTWLKAHHSDVSTVTGLGGSTVLNTGTLDAATADAL